MAPPGVCRAWWDHQPSAGGVAGVRRARCRKPLWLEEPRAGPEGLTQSNPNEHRALGFVPGRAPLVSATSGIPKRFPAASPAAAEDSYDLIGLVRRGSVVPSLLVSPFACDGTLHGCGAARRA